VFGLENEIPSILIELNTGYSIGIHLSNSVPIELKLVYPFKLFGITLEVGSLLSNNIQAYHIFLGPTFFAINNQKIRIPISLGLDILGNRNKEIYFGIGGIGAFNYSLTKTIYIVE
jgi:hypothetical protein